MNITRENAIELWEERYGTKITVTDYSGRIMDKSAYGNSDSKFGWNIDHIRPESAGGTNKQCNLEICHIQTNIEKADKFPHWEANGQRFKAVKYEHERNCYKIVKDD
jgi:hypothetical protein